MKYLREYKIFEPDAVRFAKERQDDAQKKADEIEQHLDDLFMELGDNSFIYTILNKKPHYIGGYDDNPRMASGKTVSFYPGEIKIIIGKYGWVVFEYSEIKHVMSHAISYLQENGYELDPNSATDFNLGKVFSTSDIDDDTFGKSLEINFIGKR